MASFFVTRNDATRRRAVSNGGLGGFVTIGSIKVMETSQGDGKATWPKNRRGRKKRPPPISIIQESDKYFIKQEILSPTSVVDDQVSLSLPVSRYNPLLIPSSVYGNHLPRPTPPPPVTPKQQLLPSALELPGSLLLPSQGFPQSDPPRTPARPLLCLSRSSSEESDQVWTPAVSTSSATDIEDDEMPKTFPPKHLLRAAKSSKPKTLSSPTVQELGIGKPMSAMSAEELLKELPQLGPEAVKAIWIPAMIKQHDRIKRLLQAAADVSIDTNSDGHEFGQTLESLSRDAHKISHVYERAVKSAESLVERDAKACRERLATTQKNLDAALTTIDSHQQTLRQKDDTVQQLRYTLDDIVRVLGDFIQDHTSPAILRDIEQDDVRDVMQMLTDYNTAPTDDELTGRFVRIPEEHYMASIDALREAQLKTERFREVAINQDQMISHQSSQLDSRLIDYEKSMGVIAERNHEVRLLADDNRQLRKVVEDFETGLRVSNSTRAVQDELFKDQEAMQSMLRNMQVTHAQDLKYRDTVIADLEHRLGTAKAEVLRGKADVKNVITHTQALLSPVEPLDDYGVSTLKERRLLYKGKGKTTGLPASRSMQFLSPTDQSSLAPKIPERRQSANALARPFQQPTYAMMPRDVTPQWACGVPQKQSGQDLRDMSNFSPNYAPRPRGDSTGRNDTQQVPPTGDQAMASAVVNNMLGTPIKFDPNKRLPSRPGPQYALDLYAGDNATTMDQVEDWHQQENCEPQPCNPSPALGTQRKRVLSQITERSGEDSTSTLEKEKASDKETASATGSALEEYHNGLSAARMREYLYQSGMGSPKSQERDVLPDYEGSDYYAPESELRLVEGNVAGVARAVDMPQEPAVALSRQAKVYRTSQDGSSSTSTKKSTPLRDVEGIRVLGIRG